MLEWVTVCTAVGRRARASPTSSASATAAPNLGEREVVTARLLRPQRGRQPSDVKATLAGHAAPAQGGPAVRDQDLRLDLRQPRRPAGRGALRRAAARRGRLPRAWSGGGARLSPKHANFVENTGGATTADVLAVMAAARRRVHERFGVVLEPEVQILGEVELAGRLGARAVSQARARGASADSGSRRRAGRSPAAADRGRLVLVVYAGYMLWLRDSSLVRGRRGEGRGRHGQPRAR